MYSRRLLLPYIGVIQIADLGWARALSLDGKNWAIRYTAHENKQTLSGPLRDDPRVNLSLIVTIEGEQLKTRVIRPNLDHQQIRSDSQRIFEAIHDVRLPFEAGDRYEYWLLDSHDDSPLALLHSCVDEEDMNLPVPPPEWLAMPAAELEVRDPSPPDQGIYVPPVNHRLQMFIQERAGSKPRAAWFERPDPASDEFPSCLLRDEWEDPECQRVCDLYISRLAPRLLMMGGLSPSVRQRLEQAARNYVFDVEKFYPLYPEVIDDSVLNAARVEARLRRANEA